MKNAFREKMRFLTGCSPEHTGPEKVRILAAVSGGIDSMVMVHLLYELQEAEIAVASVNFRLRGSDSDMDQELVRSWCMERNVEFFGISFDTAGYAVQKGISVEMAARELRYGWFDSLVLENNFDYLSVAHNLNDNVETLFLNLLRGTGIEGLSGIREKSGYKIRPMLEFSREKISRFAAENNIPFRVDRTNNENSYSRNRLRNIVFPELEKINPSFLNRINENISYFSEASAILDTLTGEAKERLIRENPGRGIILDIPVSDLLKELSPKFFIFHIFRKYGFNSSQARDIYESLQSQSGKCFHSEEYTLIKERENLVLIKRVEDGRVDHGQVLFIEDPGDKEDVYHFKGFTIEIRKFLLSTGFSPVKSSEEIQYLDADLITFPLTCRSRRDGDRFIPLGMRGFKKLSDFYTDLKLDNAAKESQPVLLCNGNIICLPGLRSDHRYRVQKDTRYVLSVIRQSIELNIVG